MWRMARRDAVTVWSNDLVRERLARYRAIIDLQLPARYTIAKQIPVQFDSQDDNTTLWRIHKETRNEFQKLISEKKTTQTIEEKQSPKESFLHLKGELAMRILKKCYFCERRCHVNRITDLGFCEVGKTSYVSSAFLHTGEEAPLVPSGTIFFSGCNFRCAHCQNYDISCNSKNGTEVTIQQLAKIADELASQGAKNINYVGGDPTPHIHTILNSLKYQQYNITQLWNSNMYLTEKALELLLDIIDFWLPDLKYYSEDCAKRISEVKDYTKVVTRNIKTAYDQGTKEMIIRVLVLPNHLECCVFPILEWIARNTPDALVNIMAQYRPLWKVTKKPKYYQDLTRRVKSEEMQQAYTLAEKLGLEFRSVS